MSVNALVFSCLQDIKQQMKSQRSQKEEEEDVRGMALLPFWAGYQLDIQAALEMQHQNCVPPLA